MFDFIVRLIADAGYLGIAVLMFAEHLFPPIPLELIMPFAGFVAARGELSLPGAIRKGQGLEVHMHDCPLARKLRSERDRWIDVEWETNTDRLFDVTLRLLTQNVRGVLGKVANAIAGEECNIQNVSTDGEQGTYSTLYITVQVTHRLNLAKVIRGMRSIPEVVRITRVKGDQKAS